MIKLSDYLDYLNTEIIQARKKADENAVMIAKQYAQDPYLKYFRVPRFSMPSIKMSIPVKITDLDANYKHNFQMDETAFIHDVNSRIETLNQESETEIPFITIENLQQESFQNIIHELENSDQSYVNDVDNNLAHIDFGTVLIDNPNYTVINENPQFGMLAEENTTSNPLANPKIVEIIKDAFRNRYSTVATQLNGIYFDPDTTKETDKDKLFLTLNVEMVEEGIRINEFKDKDGNIVEEITFE